MEVNIYPRIKEFEHLLELYPPIKANKFLPEWYKNQKFNNPQASSFEKKIDHLGGIDLQLLGIGTNGHIGFNEPGSDINSITRKIKLK